LKAEQKRGRGRPKSLFHDPKPSTVQALDRGLAVLKDLSKTGSATLSDLALRNAMPASSAHRILATLQKHRLVEFNDTSQEWSVGLEAFRIGSSYLERTNIIEAALPVMRRLMEETGETANLAIADKGDVVFLSQVETHNPIRAFFRPGTRGHMHSSGIGKALLASYSQAEVSNILKQKGLPEFTDKTLTQSEKLFRDLEITRERGYSFDDDERYEGMRCVASVIYDSFGEPVAGVSVSGPSTRFPDRTVPELGLKVCQAASEITTKIGGTRQAD